MRSGADLFIVDNSDSEWKVRQYLQEWAEISHQFDIATGYFEIGALLAMDGDWQKVDKLRILMGDEVSKRTKQALLAGIEAARERLDASLEKEKEKNDFLTGAPAIVEALRSRQIECKVYTKEKFHAKAYITHAKSAVIGSSALVGSSNFTYPGLTDNVELNVQIRREVPQLQEWYERHWKDAHDVTDEVLTTIERHVREYPPFDVYAKALHEYFRAGGSLDPDQWDLGSELFKKLDRYQQDGYRNLLKIAAKYNGALLCDGVGLGKTFIGLMLIERFTLRERKNVLLLVPKSGRETVWQPAIDEHLSHVGSLFGTRLHTFNHTDLSATNDRMLRQIEAATAEADVVIIDEAHNFRNIGTRGDFTADIPASGPARGGKLIEGEGKVKPSRYRKLFDLIGEKQTFLLTATPVNNSLDDLRHLIELFSRRKDDYFANHDIGIKNLRSYFNELKKKHSRLTHTESGAETNAEEARVVLERDALVSSLVVQRSRGYVKASQKLHGGRSVIFPEREPPKVAEYSLRGVYGKLIDAIDEAFAKEDPLFALPMYQPINYRRIKADPQDAVEQFIVGRQTQIVALVRTGFLKRLESSAEAFRLSCHRLLIKQLAFIARHVELPTERKSFEKWQKTHSDLVDQLKQTHPELFSAGREATLYPELEDDQDELLDSDVVADTELFSRQEFDVPEMLRLTFEDLMVVTDLIAETDKITAKKDVKLQALIKLLHSEPVLSKHKVLIFSEYADTAEYLRRELIAAGITGIEAVDGSSASHNRVGVVKRFAPYYNRSNSAEAAMAGGEIRVLISTDVLSEGLNLQDATRLINYELHWNPVRLMQRIGRVDRRLNPDVEARLLADHPDQKSLRGTAAYWNFLPPDELSELLTLYSRVAHKTLHISKTFGIEGKQLLRPDDDYDALKDFNATYERKTKVEELALEYERLLKDHPGLEARLNALPGRVFSGKAFTNPIGLQPGQAPPHTIFFCYQLPVRVIAEPVSAAAPTESGLPFDGAADGWRTDVGPVRWYLYTTALNAVLESDAPAAADLIRCGPPEPRKVTGKLTTLTDARKAVEKHIQTTYGKQVGLPLGAGSLKPILKCWMELS